MLRCTAGHLAAALWLALLPHRRSVAGAESAATVVQQSLQQEGHVLPPTAAAASATAEASTETVETVVLRTTDLAESEEFANGYEILKLKWHEVELPLVISAWILLACVGKLIFNLWRKLAESVPDSSLLIILGLILGLILYYGPGVSTTDIRLSAKVFFLYLLPPIVFDAGYFMPSRAFFDNFGTILVYAVIGTIWNTLAIGLSLIAAGALGAFRLELGALNVLLFASLISAVDPVAVLVVFEEVHVNEVLYITVFGESLLNDAVTVVLYQIFIQFSEISTFGSIGVTDVLGGIASFFIVGVGGVLIGIFYAGVVSFVTRWTGHVKMLNPLFVFLVPYCAYLTAELFSLSAIMAIVFCGICMKPYVKENIGNNARTAIRYMIKATSCSAESIIFMFLGLSFIASLHDFYWDPWFVGLTLFFCLLYRAIGVFIQTYFLNKTRVREFDLFDQFIMAYGGLRGAVAYGLAGAIGQEVTTAVVDANTQKLFMTTCEIVIFFTVFIQGATIKPLVHLLKIERKDNREKSLTESIFERVCGNCMAGLEDICGFTGHHWLRHRFDYYNTKYLKPVLQRHLRYGDDMKIVRSYHKFVDAEIRMRAASESNLGSQSQSPVGGAANAAYVVEANTPEQPSTGIPMPREHVHFQVAPADLEITKEAEMVIRKPLSVRRMSRHWDLNDEQSSHDLDEFRLLRHRRKLSSQSQQSAPQTSNGAPPQAGHSRKWHWQRRPTAYDVTTTVGAQANRTESNAGATPTRSASVHDRSPRESVQPPVAVVTSPGPAARGILRAANRASLQSTSKTVGNGLRKITEGQELELHVPDRPKISNMDSMDDPHYKLTPPSGPPPRLDADGTVSDANADLYDDLYLSGPVLENAGFVDDEQPPADREHQHSHFVKHREQQVSANGACTRR